MPDLGSIGASPRQRSWNASLAASPGALDLEIPAARIDGAIPRSMRGGRVLVNGPGWNVIGGRNLHPFDGHGYVRGFSLLPDGGVRVRARFVATPSYLAESRAGRVLHRGLGTNAEPFWRNLRRGPLRNTANTTVVRHGGRLLAGWEGGAPYALEADTLATRGEEHFGGVIAGEATLAHMKRDARSGRLVVASVENGRRTKLVFREIDGNDRVVCSHTAELGGLLFCHDFAISENWIIVAGNPLRFRAPGVAAALTGLGPFIRAVTTDPARVPVLHLVARDGTGRVRTVRLPAPGWVVHFGGAFERAGELTVDACILPRLVLGEELGYTGPHTPFDPALPDRRGPQQARRIVVPAEGDEARWELLSDYGIDFPRFDPRHEGRETGALFGATRGDRRHSDPFDTVIRLDLFDRERLPSIWTAPEHVFVSEPLPIPSREDDSIEHVASILTHGIEERSTLAIFDAHALERGPVAAVPLPLLPVSFHGDWEPPTSA